MTWGGMLWTPSSGTLHAPPDWEQSDCRDAAECISSSSVCGPYPCRSLRGSRSLSSLHSRTVPWLLASSGCPRLRGCAN